MQVDAVARVNDARAALGRPPLRVTGELTRKAQLVADHLAEIGRLEHSADLSAGVMEHHARIGITVAADGTVYEVQEYKAP